MQAPTIDDLLAGIPMAALVTDAEGTVLGINRAASTQLGGLEPGFALPEGTKASSARVHLKHGDGTVRLVVLDASADDWRILEIGRLKHEISNSIMGVMGYAELISEVPELPEFVGDAVEKIRGDMRRVTELLHELGRLLQGD